MSILPLRNPVQPYAWGSRTVIANLLGKPAPSPGPEAELWLGAHPKAPSEVLVGQGFRPLDVLLEEDGERLLGKAVLARFGKTLPFLLKVLAAEQPLSIQAHPNLDQAREGFADEERRGVPIDLGTRNYKDANHKPELICALGRFDALCGFRPVAATLRLFDALAVPKLEPYVEPLRRDGTLGLRTSLASMLNAERASMRTVITALIEACERERSRGSEFSNEYGWAIELSQLYPDDPGVLCALLLNLVVLEAGEALYLPAGNLHAYLRGAGMEIMANSDNVLRGGLTPKHMDVPELLRVLEFSDREVPRVRAQVVSAEATYPTPAEEFQLTRIVLEHASHRPSERRGPEILLCTEGQLELSEDSCTLRLEQGQAVFVGADSGHYSLDGTGTAYRATANLGI